MVDIQARYLRVMRYFILIASLFLPYIATAQWSVAQAYGDELEDIQFVDRLNGYAVGRDNGIGSCGPSISAIFRTADGGTTWVRNALDDSFEMTSVFFIDQRTGWASGYFGDSYKTTDCGQTWTRYPTNTGLEMQDIYFITEQIGFMVGENGRVLKSGNGGQNWVFTYFDTDPDFNCIEFFDDQLGLAVGGSGRIIRTTDQGDNWEDITPPEGFFLIDIDWVSEEVVFVSGSDIVLRSTDSGQSWETVFSDPDMELIRAVEFVNEQVGYFGASSGELWQTTDGGDTWSSLDFRFDEDIHAIHFIDSQLGYLSGNTGSIYRTTDGGASWLSQLTNLRSPMLFGTSNQLTGIHFHSPELGAMVGNGGVIGITHNGGLTWSRKAPITYRRLNAVRWLDEARLIAVGDSGTVMHSADSGESWILLQLDNSDYLKDLWMDPDDLNGYVMSDSALYRTTDSGQSWTQIDVPADFYRAFDFHTPDYGVLVGAEETVYTTDAGLSWSEATVFEDVGILRSVDIVNDTLTFLGASNMLCSTDGSMTFDSISTSTQLAAAEIEMINDTLGYILSNSSARRTTNGGRSWVTPSTSCAANTQGFNAIDVIDDDHAFIAGGSPLSKLWSGERRTRTFLTDSVFCLGEKFNLTYRYQGARTFGSIAFDAELSDANGLFDSPTIIGSYTNPLRNIDPSGVISCQLPSGLPEGNGYRVRVTQGSIELVATDNGVDLRLTAQLQPAVSLSIDGGLCIGAEEVTLSTTATQAGTMQTYAWTVNGLPIAYNASYWTTDTLNAGDMVQVMMSMTSSCTTTEVSSAAVSVPTPSQPMIDLSPDSTIMAGSSIQLFAAGGLSYVWTPSTSLDDAAIASPISTPDSTTTYLVTVTDANGCQATDSLTITVIDIVNDLDEQSLTFGVFPNPNTGQFYIESRNEQPHQWHLHDPNGRLISTGRTTGTLTPIEIDGLARGLYFLRIEEAVMQVVVE